MRRRAQRAAPVRTSVLQCGSVRRPSSAGAKLRDLLATTNAEVQQAIFAARHANPRWNAAPFTSRLPEGWAEFVTLHCACLASLQDGNRVEAYEKAVSALQPFLKVWHAQGGHLGRQRHPASKQPGLGKPDASPACLDVPQPA